MLYSSVRFVAFCLPTPSIGQQPPFAPPCRSGAWKKLARKGASPERMKKMTKKKKRLYWFDVITSFFFPFFLVAPTVAVDNQIVGVPLGNNVTLGCIVESSPKSINVWYKDGNTLFLFASSQSAFLIPHFRFDFFFSFSFWCYFSPFSLNANSDTLAFLPRCLKRPHWFQMDRH